MQTTKRKVGKTNQRIYNLLRSNPDMTTNEIKAHMPDLNPGTVQVAVSRMYYRGELGSRSRKLEASPTGRMTAHNTYHVKYKAYPAPKPQKVKKTRTPKVEAPKVVGTPQPAWQPEGSMTPTAEHEVLVLRHLGDIYKAMNTLAEQQDALIEVLKGTLVDLAETKAELEEERLGWWAKFRRGLA